MAHGLGADTTDQDLKLIVVHYHLRPGGIRRIIELATPWLARHYGKKLTEVIVACGEAKDAQWNEALATSLQPVPVSFFIEPTFNYLSGQSATAASIRRDLRVALGKLFAGLSGNEAIIWSHNLGIARNILLTRELQQSAAARGLRVMAHHHDWWFDNRWLRWPEMRRYGVRSLSAVAHSIFPQFGRVQHLAINHSDAAVLQRHFPAPSGWLPNLTEPAPPVKRTRAIAARQWLAQKLRETDAPVWLLPCRLLRRKNMAEALLLTRWLRPEAWLVTTGAASSPDELAYAQALAKAAQQHHWRLRLGVLAGDETDKPTVAELLAVSEAVMLTSIQEGFGLPFLEAAAARRPLIARNIPNIAPDLRRFGFRFPQSYDELWIAPELFDRAGELQRQRWLFQNWLKQLPAQCRALAEVPKLLATEGVVRPVPFSRLTLTAQLEVLAQPVEKSWALCVPFNLFLTLWRERAAQKKLQVTPWPETAAKWLSGEAYARRFASVAKRSTSGPPPESETVQEDFIREMLGAERQFPLLWSRES